MRPTVDRMNEPAQHNRFKSPPTRNKSLNYDTNNYPTVQTRSTMVQGYLRDLRAAEMIAWEMSGGDYLMSNLVCKKVETA